MLYCSRHLQWNQSGENMASSRVIIRFFGLIKEECFLIYQIFNSSCFLSVSINVVYECPSHLIQKGWNIALTRNIIGFFCLIKETSFFFLYICQILYLSCFLSLSIIIVYPSGIRLVEPLLWIAKLSEIFVLRSICFRSTKYSTQVVYKCISMLSINVYES